MIGHVIKIYDKTLDITEKYLYAIILDKFVLGNMDYLVLDQEHVTYSLDGETVIAIPLKEQLEIYNKYFIEYVLISEHLQKIKEDKI